MWSKTDVSHIVRLTAARVTRSWPCIIVLRDEEPAALWSERNIHLLIGVDEVNIRKTSWSAWLRNAWCFHRN